MTKRLLILAALLPTMQAVFAQQSDDFGYGIDIEGETKVANNLKLELEAGMRTQNNAKDMDRVSLGAALSYRLFRSSDKKLTLKANAGFEYLWVQKLSEREDKYYELDEVDHKGYNVTDAYWRDRYRITPGLSLSYTLNKRWSFALKETVQYNHYCNAEKTVTKYRYNDDDEIYAKPAEKKDVLAKDRTALRSKVSANYNIRRCPVDLFAAIDYGCGLDYTANKWKYTVGGDYKLSKTQKFTLYYRYNTEDDDDEANGHLIGVGYKIDF